MYMEGYSTISNILVFPKDLESKILDIEDCTMCKSCVRASDNGYINGDVIEIKTVDNNVVTGLNEGSASITISVLNSKATPVVINVNVVKPVKPLKIVSDEKVELITGETYQLEYYVEPLEVSQDVTFDIVDESIVTVDELGNVTGVKEGYGEIMAYVEGNETINITMGITVISGEFDEMLEFVKSAHNSQVYVVRDLPVAFGIYYTDVYGSVSDLLFNYDYEIKQDYRLTQAQLTAAIQRFEEIET